MWGKIVQGLFQICGSEEGKARFKLDFPSLDITQGLSLSLDVGGEGIGTRNESQGQER